MAASAMASRPAGESMGVAELELVDTASTKFNTVTTIAYEMDGNHFVYAGGDSGYLDVFRMNAQGRLFLVETVAMNNTKGPARGLVADKIFGSHYLFAGNKGGNAVEVFKIGEDGKLQRVFMVQDTDETHLGTVITLRILHLKTGAYLFVGGLELESPGLTCFRIEAGGRLVHVQSQTDDEHLHTDGIIGMYHHTINGKTFLFTGGFQDNGVSSFRVYDDGRFENVCNVDDNDTDRFLTGTYPIEGVSLGTNYYLVVGHRHHKYYGNGYAPEFIKKKDFVYHGDGVSIFKVSERGELIPHYVLKDDEETKLVGQTRIELFKLSEEEALVAVGTRDDQSIQLCRLDQAGTLTPTGVLHTGYPIYYGMAAHQINSDRFILAGSVSNKVRKLFSYKVNLPAAPTACARPQVLRHVVSFKYKPEVTEAQIHKAIQQFAALQKSIPEIIGFEGGLNNSTEGHSKGFTHCFTVTFPDESAREIYLVHPEHLALVEKVKPLLEDVFVMDYLAPDGSE
jgi:hypothetical protein